MPKVYNPNSGSQESLYQYIQLSLEEAKKLVENSISENRLIMDVKTFKLIKTSEDVKEDDVIKILPMVGGG